jgi:hypothetical protein
VACSSRYAEAWQFAGYFCVQALLLGVDNSGGAGNAFLTDTQIDFTEKGVYANEGMTLYNVTQGTNGPVTNVTPNRLTATGVTWNDGDSYRIAALNASQRAAIEHNLDLASSDIHAARAASGGCDCNLASWAADYLARLNCVIAAAFYSCSCGRPAVNAMSDDTRNAYRIWAQEQVDAIRSTKIELCDGETGSEFPVTGSAQQATTEFAARDIISGDWLRNNG